jgi:hypothetical protein
VSCFLNTTLNVFMLNIIMFESNVYGHDLGQHEWSPCWSSTKKVGYHRLIDTVSAMVKMNKITTVKSFILPALVCVK